MFLIVINEKRDITFVYWHASLLGPPSASADSSNITLTAPHNVIRLRHGLRTIHRQVRAVNSSPGHGRARRRTEAGFVDRQEGTQCACARPVKLQERASASNDYRFKAAIYWRKNARTPQKLGQGWINEQKKRWYILIHIFPPSKTGINIFFF